jgi:hypothetical protein
MSAVQTDMRDFIHAIERVIPWGLHGCTDTALHEYLSEMRDCFDDPAAVQKLTGKICRRVVQELEFTAENCETVGHYRDAYRVRRRAQRFAKRFNQPCKPWGRRCLPISQ